jgi:hypothetical protein
MGRRDCFDIYICMCPVPHGDEIKIAGPERGSCLRRPSLTTLDGRCYQYVVLLLPKRRVCNTLVVHFRPCTRGLCNALL